MVARSRSTDRDRVASGDARAPARPERAQRVGRARRRSPSPPGRLGPRDLLDRTVGAHRQRQLVHAAVRRGGRDRPHPGLAAAPRVRHAPRPTDPAQVRVVAGHVTPHELPRGGALALGRPPREQTLDHSGVDDPAPEQIGVEVGRPADEPVRGLAGTEPPRPLGVHRDVVVGDRAEVVAREGVSVAVPEPAVARRLDVRDAVGRTPDHDALALGVVRLRCRRPGEGREGHGGGDARRSRFHVPTLQGCGGAVTGAAAAQPGSQSVANVTGSSSGSPAYASRGSVVSRRTPAP
jgi:hypothetical protein